jgi:Ferritin-like
MKHPLQWNKTDLHRHLQHALDLELWTGPLYLTALHSIKGLKEKKHSEYPDAAKLIYSVVVQEMLHLELVSNISNALGFSPRFNLPVYDERKGIPFIHPTPDSLPPALRGYKVKPQALNENSLRLFCAIELPHPAKETIWENEKSYTCIAELYKAVALGISSLWDECYVGDKYNTRQKNIFKEYHNSHGRHHGFSITVHSAETACKAMDAIVEQGEGADSARVPSDYRPPDAEEGQEFNTASYKSQLSHYQKFRMLLHAHHKLPPVYQVQGEGTREAQRELQTTFADFIREMETGFNSDGENMHDSFWKKMFGLAPAITGVWESGGCPDFAFDRSEKYL